jgi:hypothetical protein
MSSIINALRAASIDADEAFLVARDAYYAAIDACAANYSDDAWTLIDVKEAEYRAAREAMDLADFDLNRMLPQ